MYNTFYEQNDDLNLLEYEICSNYPEEEIGYYWKDADYPSFHCHDHWELFIVTEGTLKHFINGAEASMSQGSMWLIRPNDVHSIVFESEGKKCKYLNFSFKTEYIKKVLLSYGENVFKELLEKNITVATVSEAELHDVISSILNIRSMDTPKDNVIFELKLIVGKLLNIVVKSIYSVRLDMPTWLTNFLYTLSDPFAEANVEKLAKLTPYSYSRLAPVFKKYTGKTIIEYLTITKMKTAKDWLITTDMTVNEICSKLNYDSVSHFIRTFKKEYGTSPSVVRKTTGKRNSST